MQNVLVENAIDLGSQGDPTAPKTESPKVNVRSEWIWLILVCLILGVSGTLRYWREWQFQSIAKQSELPPFPLSEFPKVLKGWQMVEGSETTLDPEVARIAGSTDHIVRTYRDEKSGENIILIILYGHAQDLYAHTPEVCYPAAGFKSTLDSVKTLQIPLSESQGKVPFKRGIYSKIKLGAALHEESLYSFLNAGQWWTEPGSQWKLFRYHPGMFKVQVQRKVSGTFTNIDETPVEGFLGVIVEEIERRLGISRERMEGAAAPTTKVATASSAVRS